MRYLQKNSGNKLHLVYELGDLGLTQPVCGRKFNNYRASFNVPLGHACKSCLKRINSPNFNKQEFIKKHI